MATGLENLRVYKLAAELELRVFELTEAFPREEKYRSVDQLRRSSSSVSNNIAESYHKRSTKEKVHILRDIVNGEAEETKRNLQMCAQKGFHQDFAIIERYSDLMKMVSGFVRFLRLRDDQTKKLSNQ